MEQYKTAKAKEILKLSNLNSQLIVKSPESTQEPKFKLIASPPHNTIL